MRSGRQLPAQTTQASGLTLSFFTGFGLLCAAQWLMARGSSLFGQGGWGEWLNTRYHLDIAYADNALLAVGLLLVGGGLCAYGLVGGAATRLPDDQPDPVPPVHCWIAVLPLMLLGVAALLFSSLAWQLAHRSSSDLLPAVWLAVLALLAVASYLLDRRARARLAPALDWRDLALIAAILALGLLVGTYQLDRFPDILIPDEQEFWLAAKTLADIDAITPPIFGFGLFSYPILGSFYQAWILQVFGQSLWSWRFSSVLAAVLAAVPTYMLARELFGRRVAALSSALMVVTPYFLAFERLGYNNAQAILPVALALYLVYAGWQRHSLLFLVLGGIVAGLGFYTYTAARVGLLVGLAFVALAGLAQVRARRVLAASTLVLATAFLLGWAATALPHLIYGSATNPGLLREKTMQTLFANSVYAQNYYAEPELYRDFPPIQSDNATFFYRPDLYAELLFRGAVRSLLVFHRGDFRTDHFIVAPLAGPAAVPFYCLGMVRVLIDLRQRRSLLLALWFVGGVVLLSVIDAFPPRQAHMVPILPAMSIISALGGIELASRAVNWLPAYRRAAIGIIASILFGWLALTGLQNYFGDVRALYRQDIDNMIGFMALEREAPIKMRYVYSDPHEQEYVPWIIRTMTTQADFQTVARGDLAAGRVALDSGAEYVFFFHEQDQAVAVAFLERALQRPVSPSVYMGAGDHVILVHQFGGDKGPPHG